MRRPDAIRTRHVSWWYSSSSFCGSGGRRRSSTSGTLSVRRPQKSPFCPVASPASAASTTASPTRSYDVGFVSRWRRRGQLPLSGKTGAAGTTFVTSTAAGDNRPNVVRCGSTGSWQGERKYIKHRYAIKHHCAITKYWRAISVSGYW